MFFSFSRTHGKVHHECERNEYQFSLLREYLKIFHLNFKWSHYFFLDADINIELEEPLSNLCISLEELIIKTSHTT